MLLPESVEDLRQNRTRSNQRHRAILEATLEPAGLVVSLLGDVKLYRDAGVQDQLPRFFTLAQSRVSRSALTISVESENVRPEAASLSENARAFLAQRLGSPVARREGFILAFFSAISLSFRALLAELAFGLPGESRSR